MKTIARDQIKNNEYRQILDTEVHHDHEIIEDNNGVLRWKENSTVVEILDRISLNDLCPLLDSIGYGKNSEVYRKLYRDMGYSLSGYWEIFYWDLNNEDWEGYAPNKQ